MSDRSLFRRLFSVEVIAGALAGATVPYAIALAVEVAPARVPVGLVVLSVGGGALLGWLLVRAVRSRRQRLRAAQELEAREQQELRAQLQQIEQAISRLPSARRGWLRRRNP